MARLKDVKPVLRAFGTWSFCKRVWQQINEDGIFVWASALAYSWLFAIFPFLIFMLTLVPYLPINVQNSADRIVTGFVSTMLGKAAPTINDNIEKVIRQPRQGWLGFGLLLSLWAASGGLSTTMAALDRCYDIKRGRPYYKQRSIAVCLTILTAGMTLAVVILIPIGTAIERWLAAHSYLPLTLRIIFDVVRYLLALLLMLSVLAVIYYYGTSIRQRFQPLSPGAIFSIVVWILLDLVFRFYIDHFAKYELTYGTVGGAAILLLFFYVDALVLLVGAEINSEIDFEILGVPPGSTDFTVTPKTEKNADAAPKMAQEL
jgi:membrane protein